MTGTANERGLIFNIIHGSFVDGPGIRTIVYLKGCPLRCIWCCIPEGQESHPELRFVSALCNRCGKCVKVCPVGAIRQTGPDEIIEIDRELCTNCGECVEVCFTGALELFGRYVTVDELFDIVKKDDQFYRASGGGVTISGGEPTFQADFTLAFIRKCKENGIHTALDTSGYTTSGKGLEVLDEADLLLYDLKGWDPKKHLSNTGAPIGPILENLKRAADRGQPLIIRISIVPGYNDSDEDIESVAEFMSGLKSLESVDIIAYHEFGMSRYGQLGREYRVKAPSPSQERLYQIKENFERHGLTVEIVGPEFQ